MRVCYTDRNRHAHYAIHVVYPEGTHANITAEATRATSNSQWLAEHGQHSALGGNLQVHGSLSASSYACHACNYIQIGTCIVMHTAMSQNHSLM